MKSNKPIKFHSPADEYGCFEKFSKHKVDYNGREFETDLFVKILTNERK